MIIVGITGKIKHGKTTFADMLARQAHTPKHFESWQIIAEVASYIRQSNLPHPAPDDIPAINQWLTMLPEAVLSCVHVDISYATLKLTPERMAAHPEYYQKLFDYLHSVQDSPNLATVEIGIENKDQFRSLLQWLGGYLVAVSGSGIWYDEIVRRITYVNTGGSDLVIVGGVRYPSDAERLRNAGAVILEIQRPNQPNQDSNDLTERDRNLIKADALILNDAGLKELEKLAAKVFADLQIRELEPSYQAATIIKTAV